MTNKTYAEKLKDPRWQKRRLEIFERDDWACQYCFSKRNTLNVHHIKYKKNKAPWDYPDNGLITLCDSCHDFVHAFKTKEELKYFVRVLDYLRSPITKEEFDLLKKFEDYFEKVICRPEDVDLNTIKGKNEQYLRYLDHFKTFCIGADMAFFITTPENLIHRLGNKANDCIVNGLTIYLGD